MNRIDEPRNQRSRDTRAAILDATVKLLESGGGAGVTMAAVAKRAGITRRGLYLHFGSRGQLLSALIEHLNERLDLAGSVRPVWEAPDAVSALDAWARHIAGFHSQLVPVVLAVERVRDDDPDAEALYQRAMAGWKATCQRLARGLEAEQRLAEPWTAGTAADLLWALMSIKFVDDLIGESGWSVDDLGERLSVLLRSTLTR